MGLTDEQLNKLCEYASALLPPGEIAILMGIPPEDRKEFAIRCRTREGDPVYEAFHLGRLISLSSQKLDLLQPNR